MIDPKLQAELRQRFNPDGSLIRNVQLRMLEMLKYIDKICRANNIKYWLSSGTCLGAVRHGGFIPWDDDVDIELEKPDFLRLVEILKRDEKYFLQDHSTDIEYLSPYAKLRDKNSFLKEQLDIDIHYKNQGIYVDIFCIEPSSSYILSRFSSICQHRLLYQLYRIKNNSLRRSVINGIYFALHRGLYPFVSFVSKMNSRGWYRHIPGSSFCRRRFIDDFKEIKYVPFEDTMFPIPIRAESYLEKLYGNFMSIPPIDSLSPHIQKVELFS